MLNILKIFLVLLFYCFIAGLIKLALTYSNIIVPDYFVAVDIAVILVLYVLITKLFIKGDL